MRVALSLAASLLASSAFAANVNSPAPQGYPYTSCGWFFGLDTQAITGSTSQGEIGGLVGYSCPLGANAFWFVEGDFNFANLNSTSGGINLIGPVSLEQRLAFGSPLSSLLGLFPSLGVQVPTLPILPTGVTVTTTHPYIFGSIHEQDITASMVGASNKEWEISPGFGVGVLNQLSNGVALDVFAEAQFQNKAICVPNSSACVGQGTLYRLGMAIKY